MSVRWTEEQKKVIDVRNKNVLVSAAAGSGKTAVLVERILSLVCGEGEDEKPLDVDRLLVVTFTKAAAAEMRERVGLALEKRLEADPENEHLQKQQTLIHSAQITTIDSFCQYVIRNYFHQIDLDPAFRIGDEGELKLLKGDVVQELLEEHYGAEAPEERAKFTRLTKSGFIDTYRYFYPDTEGVYSWWSYRFHAREKNAGWRIDYFLTSKCLDPHLKDAKILTGITGSDHCPVELDFDPS